MIVSLGAGDGEVSTQGSTHREQKKSKGIRLVSKTVDPAIRERATSPGMRRFLLRTKTIPPVVHSKPVASTCAVLLIQRLVR